MNPKQPIKVSFSLNSPPIKGQSPFIWQESVVKKEPQDIPIEKAIGAPEGAIGVLRAAFAKSLNRYHIWDLSHIKDKKPYLYAARVFKRGVQVQDAPHSSLKGGYEIVFKKEVCLKDEPFFQEGFVVVDEKVHACWHKSLAAKKPHIFSLTETSKDLSSVFNLIEKWQQDGRKKHWFIIGGGVLSDTAAFCAALLGCDFTLMPTTLLAMVDACVGGKTGVNFPPFGKNQVGLFAFPSKVIMAPCLTKTLPKRQLNAGTAEALKHAILKGDRELCEKIAMMNNPFSYHELLLIIRPLIEVKAQVVAKDPSEKSIRATLNLGHTLAHALEAISHQHAKDILLHGEAVGLGLLFAAMLSKACGHLPQEQASYIEDSLKKSGCLMDLASLKKHLGIEDLESSVFLDKLLTHIHQDKKRGPSGASQWVLLKSLGQCVNEGGSYTVPVPDEAIKNTFASFTKKLAALT